MSAANVTPPAYSEQFARYARETFQKERALIEKLGSLAK